MWSPPSGQPDFLQSALPPVPGQLSAPYHLPRDPNRGISLWKPHSHLRGLPMHRIVAAVSIFLCLAPLARGAEAPPDAGTMKAVLVTGASTGIGRKITERLAADGYFVYAGARKDSDLQALGAIKNVQAVRLDVTKVDDIEATRKIIERGHLGLYGLVNNAGVVHSAMSPTRRWKSSIS